MILLTVDFETYYDNEYSLSKMTTVEYIRDERFEVILCGFQVDDGERYWVPGPLVANELKKFNPKEVCLLCQKGHFDLSILCWIYGFNPAFYLDTLPMFQYCFPAERARLANIGPVLGLGDKGTELVNAKGKHLEDFTEEELEAFGAYCLTDVRLTYEAFQIMKTRVLFKELQLIDLILRMYTEPILELDPEILQTLYDDEREKTVALFSTVYPQLEATARQAIFSGDEPAWKALKTPLSSNPQFAKLLMEYDIDPPKKLSPSGVKSGRIIPEEVEEKPYGILPPKEKTWTYAFSKSDEEFKDLLEHENDDLRTLCELRVNAKSTIKTTRSKKMLDMQKTGNLPVPLKPFAAHTGRPGGSEWNPMNMPKFCAYCFGKGCPKCLDTGVSQIRLSLTAPKGHVIVVRDFSQIEARVLAYLAGQDDILELFRQGVSVYCHDASELFGRTITKTDFLEYALGKVKRLGLGYGLYTRTFQERVRVGILGMPGMILGDEIANALGVSGENFLLTNAKLVRETKPKKIDELVHATHVACCDRICRSFRDENKKIVDFWAICQNALETMISGGYDRIGRNGLIEVIPEGFRLPNGFVIQYTDLKVNREGKRPEFTILKDRQKGERGKVYAGLCAENIDQGWSRTIATDAMLEMRKVGMRVVHMVYDEILVVCKEVDAEDVYKEMGGIMEKPPACAPDLPLASSGGWDRRYVK
jgi:hypothetical protein